MGPTPEACLLRRWLKKRGERGAEPRQDPPAPAPAGPPPPPVPGTEGSASLDQTMRVDRTQVVKTARPSIAYLDVIEGSEAVRKQRFRVASGQTTIGRSPDCDISLPDPAISRVHAVLVADQGSIAIEHHSQTNETFVNGSEVRGRRELSHGDQIQLADRVILQLEAPTLKAPVSRDVTLRQAMEARVDLDRRIEEEFVSVGSFLDVDVVDSYGMKQHSTREDYVVVSFERFRSYITQKVEGRQGRVLNSNGDEVMAFFESADSALASARDLIRDLPQFNDRQNLLGDGFQIRVGIHTGRSAVDLASGIAYSPVLDGAGHLQKAAQVDSLLLSNETYEALSDASGLRSVGESGKRGIDAWAPESDA